MKSHEIEKFWRRIDKQEIPSKLAQLEFIDIPAIGTGTLKFKSQITLLCGPNGVGKTTLLRTLWALLSPVEAKASPSSRARLASGVASVDFQTLPPTSIAIDFANLQEAANQKLNFEVQHIDTSSVVTSLQDHYCNFANIEDALNGVPYLECDAEELSDLKFLTQNEYSAARIYSIEEENLIRPYFEVEAQGVTYDARTMGLGELATFYLWWSLRSLADGALLLLEEPESYLSPRSQRSLIGYLAKYAAKKKARFVITTHSSSIVRGAKDSHTEFLIRQGGHVRSATEAKAALLSGIGIEARPDRIVLVEDRTAATFAKLWIAHFDSMTADRLEIVHTGGHARITTLLTSLEIQRPQILKIVGLYDGDQRGATDPALSDHLSFLPSERPIEELYQNMCASDLERITPLIPIPGLAALVYALRQLEPHDWFQEFGQRAHCEPSQLNMMMFKAWIADPAWEAVAFEAFKEFLAVLNA